MIGVAVRFGSVDPGCFGQGEDLGFTTGGEPFRVGRTGCGEGLGASCRDLVGVPEMHIRWGVKPDPDVMVMSSPGFCRGSFTC